MSTHNYIVQRCLSILLHSQALEIPQICKDKDEAEVWFVGLKALLARGSHRKTKSEARSEAASSDSPNVWRVSRSSSFVSSTFLVVVNICHILFS